MNKKQKNSCCESFCASEPFTRENYYFGKLLTAQALKGEQQYLNEKRWLINRYGIGWGVLCGLKVIPDCNNPCGGFIVQPGLALDKYGNEILVCEPQYIDIKSACLKDGIGNIKQGESRKLYITLHYKECQSNPSPIPVDNCCKLEDKCVYNRTQETFEIKIVCEEPEKPQTIREEIREDFADISGCESGCVQFLNNLAPFIIDKCRPRHKCCEITLASICYTERTPVQEHHIDNFTYRKLAFSNEMLYAMIRCLSEETREEARQAKGDRHDRRQHVPLLANTIKGLTYKDGKIAKVEAGKHPFRVTSDGDVIWITDRESPKLIRIDRKNNKPSEGKPIDLSCCDKSIESSWGIAFDGSYMWITHNNAGQGKLTRVNTCKLDDCWTFSALPDCTDLKECQKHCVESSDNKIVDLPLSPYPQEVVYDQNQNLLYVSHGWAPESNSIQSQVNEDTNEKYPEKSTTLLISIIDTERCCLVKTVSLTNNDCVSISPISSMVSDGEALWITYTASLPHYKKPHNQPVVQKIKYDSSNNECEIGDQYIVDKGHSSGKLAFDGTHLWLTHDDGASKIELSTGKVVDHIETEQTQVAVAYGGGDNIWTAEYNNGEARLNRTDIHSVDRNGEIEFVSDLSGYVITDAQFDGVFIYVSGYSESGEGTDNQGIVYRILP